MTIRAGLLASVVRAQSADRQKVMEAPARSQELEPALEFDNAVKLADKARLAGRLSEALDLYAKALRIRPQWPEGWWNVGTILYDGDSYVDARDAFRNLVALDSKNGPAWGMLGLCEFQTREYDRAVVSMHCGRALGLGRNIELESVVRHHAAQLYIRFEQFEIAFEILTEFLQTGNESPRVIEAFGLTILRMPFLVSEIPPDKREQVLIAGRAGF